jgi:hypothetical protein
MDGYDVLTVTARPARLHYSKHTEYSSFPQLLQRHEVEGSLLQHFVFKHT